MYRLGYLSSGAPADPSDFSAGPYLLAKALNELGYSENRNLVVERRFAEGKLDRLSALAKELGEARVDAFYVTSGPVNSGVPRSISQFVAKYRLPSITDNSLNLVRNGTVLMAYSASARALGARTAYFVDRILRGTKPADLPIELPSKFELFINLKNAKALGLTIPPSLLSRADEIIE